MKILLTGATGFIGSAFARAATHAGHQVIPLCRPWIAQEADCLVHAAWITTPGQYLESTDNLKCLRESVRLFRESQEDVRHIVGLGTCLEYRPHTTYAKCKLELQTVLKEMDPWYSWARIFYPYGPGEHPLRLCSYVIASFQANQTFFLNHPHTVADYIYIDDVASALLAIVEKQSVGTLDIGTGFKIRLGEILQTIATQMGKTRLLTSHPSDKPHPYDGLIAKTDQLRKLGWRPSVIIPEGISRLIRNRTDAK